MLDGKCTRHVILATCLGLLLVVALGDLAQAQQQLQNGSIFEKMPTGLSAKEQQAYRDQVCSNPPLSAAPVPAEYVQFCGDRMEPGQDPANLEPNTQRGPVITQDAGHAATGLGTTSVATIGTLASFGALVIPDFPADLEVLQSDLQNVYQITSAGVASRYNSSGVNSALPSISPPAGQSWTDLAVDPTTGVVYGVSAVCGTTSTLSTLNLSGGTSAIVGVIQAASSCIVGLAADNAGNLWGYDIVADNLISINKVTGAGTIVGPIGFNANFGQAMDCDPSTGTCYLFAFNATTSRPELRSVNLATGATTLIGVIGLTSPGAGVQVSGGVFATIGTCAVDADCSDGNPCNGVETCQAPNCVPGTPIVCNDGLFCTTDTCNPATGLCQTAPNTCSDGDGCTVDNCDEANDVCTHTAVTPVRFCSGGSIQIPATGTGSTAGSPSNPYPSTIAVAGLGTSASLCSVELNGMTHTFPDDVDIMLVGPAGGSQNRSIMSDVGGGTDVVGISLTLKDAAATLLPDAGPLVSGTFKPNNVGATDPFPAPAPAPTGLAPLSLFNNINPNGNWSLYVTDDSSGDSGSLQAWCLNIVVSSCSADADCSDGQACNGAEVCNNGACQPGTPVNCDDQDVCTVDTCINPAGTCNHAPLVCNDNNICTDDTCVSPTQGCTFTPNTAPCSDNNPCTTGDICGGGSCQPGGPTNCDDANECTTDSCSPATGCTHVASAGGPCSDGNPCTENDTCQIPCNGSFSENFDGVVAPALPAGWTTQLVTGQAGDNAWRTAPSTDTPPNGGNTDDPNHVTDKVLNSTVLPGGAVQVTFRNSFATEASPPSYYDGGVLEIKIGAGPFQDIIAAGGSFVTGGYTGTISTSFSSPIAGRMAWSGNSSGFITTTVNLPPSSAGQPTILRWRLATDSSVAATGQTIDTIRAVTCSSVCSPGTPGSAPCDDGNPCTSNDTCGGGTCHGGPPTDCNDNNPCTNDSCDPASGCVHSPNTDPCDDGNACTTNDTCGGGTCHGGPPPNCNDGNVCTDDSCNPANGCENVNNTSPCNDGNACTTNDTCGGGSCHGGAPPDCNDGNVCTDDSCDPGSGCVNASNNSCNTKGQGYWKRLCHGPHSGDFYSQFDVDCVNNTCTFGSVHSISELCDRLNADPPSDKCEQAEVSFMSLVLNLCRQRVLPSQSINSRCGPHQTAGESQTFADAALCNPDRTTDDCQHAECASEEIANGEALWANTLRLTIETGGLRLTWSPPYANPSTLLPRKYRVYRKSGPADPFVQVAEISGGSTSWLDTGALAGTTPYDYEIVSNW